MENLTALTLLPFTREQFLQVFQSYNLAIYPFQLILILLALMLVFLATRPGLNTSKVISALLCVLWLWTGVVYHGVFFTRINKVAYFFALLSVIGGIIFLGAGVIRSELRFHARLDTRGIVGALLIVYALALYPSLGYLFGHTYPQSPTFGAPCPTTIFTFGLLLWANKDVPFHVVVIPLVWAIIGSTAVMSLGMWEDLALLVAAVSGTALLVPRRKGPAKTGMRKLIRPHQSTYSKPA